MFVIDSMCSESYVCSKSIPKQGCVDVSCTADHRVEEVEEFKKLNLINYNNKHTIFKYVSIEEISRNTGHDNTRSNTSRAAMEEIERLNFTILPHPLYSPDLAP